LAVIYKVRKGSIILVDQEKVTEYTRLIYKRRYLNDRCIVFLGIHEISKGVYWKEKSIVLKELK